MNKIYPAANVLNLVREQMVVNISLIPLMEGESPREFAGSDLETGGSPPPGLRR